MKSYAHRFVAQGMVTVLLWAFFLVPGSPAVHSSLAQVSSLNALYLKTVPVEYKTLEKLFASFKDSGADTIILRPRIVAGSLDRDLLTNEVFLCHQAGLKLFVILPTRTSSEVAALHPDWEDMRYDLGSGTLQPAGRLDLFNPSVMDYLVRLFKETAAYSVDGILLDDDFYYSDVEGASVLAQDAYARKFGTRLALSKAITKVSAANSAQEYGEPFRNWNALKKELLIAALQNIGRAARTLNSALKIGIPLHVPPFINEEDELTLYSYDMNALRKMDIDFFWVDVPHRTLRARQDLNYKKSIELFSRIVKSAVTLVKEPAKIIVAIQPTSLSGTILPLTEIEEVAMLAKNAGEPGIAFTIEPDTLPPPVLTKKIFKRQPI